MCHVEFREWRRYDVEDAALHSFNIAFDLIGSNYKNDVNWRRGRKCGIENVGPGAVEQLGIRKNQARRVWPFQRRAGGPASPCMRHFEELVRQHPLQLP